MRKQTTISKNYDDIIHLPHHISNVHPKMPVSDRAAQFSPFAALTGYEDVIKETARLTEERQELDEDKKEILRSRLQLLKNHDKWNQEISVTYFVPDEKKEGGKYVITKGKLKKVDEYTRCLVFEDASLVPIAEIIEIEGPCFETESI